MCLVHEHTPAMATCNMSRRWSRQRHGEAIFEAASTLPGAYRLVSQGKQKQLQPIRAKDVVHQAGGMEESSRCNRSPAVLRLHTETFEHSRSYYGRWYVFDVHTDDDHMLCLNREPLRYGRAWRMQATSHCAYYVVE
jgi:hypothetical protein